LEEGGGGEGTLWWGTTRKSHLLSKRRFEKGHQAGKRSGKIRGNVDDWEGQERSNDARVRGVPKVCASNREGESWFKRSDV